MLSAGALVTFMVDGASADFTERTRKALALSVAPKTTQMQSEAALKGIEAALRDSAAAFEAFTRP